MTHQSRTCDIRPPACKAWVAQGLAELG
jgi:hypothetical protein